MKYLLSKEKTQGRYCRRIRRFDVDEIATWLETSEIDEDRLNA